MKLLIEQVEKEGLEALMGKKVTLMCVNYFYSGKLVGVNASCVKLEDPAIVFETGDFKNKKYGDEQALGVKYWYVALSAVESFGELY